MQPTCSLRACRYARKHLLQLWCYFVQGSSSIKALFALPILQERRSSFYFSGLFFLLLNELHSSVSSPLIWVQLMKIATMISVWFRNFYHRFTEPLHSLFLPLNPSISSSLSSVRSMDDFQSPSFECVFLDQFATFCRLSLYTHLTHFPCTSLRILSS